MNVIDNSFLKVLLRNFYKKRLSRICLKYSEDNLSRSAVVFSPHFDDETLGCGGTILKKKKAHSNIKIAFMTDGGKSHRGFLSENELKQIRSNEALDACRSLGLDACDVYFLDFETRRLDDFLESATERVLEIILRQQPEEIFVPYSREPALWSRDHLATNYIVLSALRNSDISPDVYEYPVWFWHHWPWVNMPVSGRRRALGFLKKSLISGWNLLHDFRCSVPIADVMDRKRFALDQYKSQMTRLLSEQGWRTLKDISNGEFLECFFQPYEIFHCRRPC